MNTRLVEFCETVRIAGRTYAPEARDHFSEDVAAQYIELGWCKDPETGEQGVRKPGASGPIRPDPSRSAVITRDR